MALRDLVADHKKIAEETVEKIVAPYVRYDAAARKIVWTPQGRSLGNDAKILVFLVATLGWDYILNESPNAATKPSDLEGELGIVGGTLRPLLKKLKDHHLLMVSAGHYRVQLANVDAIEAAIAGELPKGGRKGSARKVAKPRDNRAEGETGETRRKARSGASQLKVFLTKWVGDGFFTEPKTLASLLERYHEHGVITKQTSLSGLMLEAVREGALVRTKIDVRGKQVWAYRKP